MMQEGSADDDVEEDDDTRCWSTLRSCSPG